MAGAILLNAATAFTDGQFRVEGTLTGTTDENDKSRADEEVAPRERVATRLVQRTVINSDANAVRVPLDGGSVAVWCLNSGPEPDLQDRSRQAGDTRPKRPPPPRANTPPDPPS